MSTAFSGVLAGVDIRGATGANGSGKPQYGLYIESTAYVSIMSVQVSAQCSVAGIYCGNWGYTLYDCKSSVSPGTGVDWRMPPGAGVRFINCNNPGVVLRYQDLPSPVGLEGTSYDISDGNIASNGPGGGLWGGTVTGGGTSHVRVRSNGTVYTAMGL
jgi:hypothetical protein